jgi:hypothetical protein
MASGRKNNRTKAPKADEAKRATFLVDSQLHFGFKILSEKAERDMSDILREMMEIMVKARKINVYQPQYAIYSAPERRNPTTD